MIIIVTLLRQMTQFELWWDELSGVVSTAATSNYSKHSYEAKKNNNNQQSNQPNVKINLLKTINKIISSCMAYRIARFVSEPFQQPMRHHQ